MEKKNNVPVIRKGKKTVLLTTVAFFSVLLFVISAISLYILLGKKKPGGNDNPPLMKMSVALWSGEKNSEQYISNFAERGNKTITIDSAESFVWFIDQVNSGAYDTSDTPKIYLNTSIDFAGQEIDSIGTAEHPFRGVFDGSYFTLMNVKIKGNGLFGVTDGAKIYNVGLYNATINSNAEFVGGLIATAKNTDVKDCFVNGGKITAADSSIVGGLIGKIENNDTKFINNSFADISINSSNVGGLIGSLNASQKLTMNFCYFVEGANAIHTIVENSVSGLAHVGQAKPMLFNGYDYASQYDQSKTWCDFSFKSESIALKFDYPILTNFAKVYQQGGYYEAVTIIDGEVLDMPSIEESVKLINEGSTATVNTLGVDSDIEQEMVIPKNSNVTIKAVKDTQITRGLENETSLIHSIEGSVLKIGNENAGDNAPTITIHGNAEYVVANNLLSGPAVVAEGEFYGYGNVIICNNANTYTSDTDNGGPSMMSIINSATGQVDTGPNGCGGGMYSTGGGRFSGNITSCHASHAGGGAFFGGSNMEYTLDRPTIKYCTAKVAGGGIYAQETVNVTMYGGTISYCTAPSGGGVCIRGASFMFRQYLPGGSYSGTDDEPLISFCGNTRTSISGETIESTVYGGAIRLEKNSSVDITSSRIQQNYATYGGAIFNCGSTLRIGYHGNTINSTDFMLNKAFFGGDIFTEAESQQGNTLGHTILGDLTAVSNGSYAFSSSSSEASDCGGSLYVNPGGNLTINDCLIYSSAEKSGGAIQVYGSNANLTINGGYIGKVQGSVGTSGTCNASYGGAIRVGSGATMNITGGSIQNSIASSNGGAIYVDGGSNLTISGNNNIIHNCSAQNGGGVYLTDSSTMTIDGDRDNPPVIRNGKATNGFGGGIYVDAGCTLDIDGGGFPSCTASEGGGGIYNAGTTTIDGTSTGSSLRPTFFQCSAPKGAGIYQGGANASLTMNYARFDGCTSTTNGSVVSANSGSVTINSIKIDNIATCSGGEIYVSNATLNCNTSINGQVYTDVTTTARTSINVDSGWINNIYVNNPDSSYLNLNIMNPSDIINIRLSNTSQYLDKNTGLIKCTYGDPEDFNSWNIACYFVRGNILGSGYDSTYLYLRSIPTGSVAYNDRLYKYYSSISLAISAASDSDTIDVITNISCSSTININKPLTLRSKGGSWILNYTGSENLFNVSSTFNIGSASSEAFPLYIKGSNNTGTAINLNGSNAKLTLNRANITNFNYGVNIDQNSSYLTVSCAVVFNNNTTDYFFNKSGGKINASDSQSDDYSIKFADNVLSSYINQDVLDGSFSPNITCQNENYAFNSSGELVHISALYDAKIGSTYYSSLSSAISSASSDSIIYICRDIELNSGFYKSANITIAALNKDVTITYTGSSTLFNITGVFTLGESTSDTYQVNLVGTNYAGTAIKVNGSSGKAVINKGSISKFATGIEAINTSTDYGVELYGGVITNCTLAINNANNKGVLYNGGRIEQ